MLTSGLKEKVKIFIDNVRQKIETDDVFFVAKKSKGEFRLLVIFEGRSYLVDVTLIGDRFKINKIEECDD